MPDIDPAWKRRLSKYKAEKSGEVHADLPPDLIELAERARQAREEREAKSPPTKPKISRLVDGVCCECGVAIRVSPATSNNKCEECTMSSKTERYVNTEPWNHDAKYHGGTFNNGEW